MNNVKKEKNNVTPPTSPLTNADSCGRVNYCCKKTCDITKTCGKTVCLMMGMVNGDVPRIKTVIKTPSDHDVSRAIELRIDVDWENFGIDGRCPKKVTRSTCMPVMSKIDDEWNPCAWELKDDGADEATKETDGTCVVARPKEMEPSSENASCKFTDVKNVADYTALSSCMKACIKEINDDYQAKVNKVEVSADLIGKKDYFCKTDLRKQCAYAACNPSTSELKPFETVYRITTETKSAE